MKTSPTPRHSPLTLGDGRRRSGGYDGRDTGRKEEGQERQRPRRSAYRCVAGQGGEPAGSGLQKVLVVSSIAQVVFLPFFVERKNLTGAVARAEHYSVERIFCLYVSGANYDATACRVLSRIFSVFIRRCLN